MNEFFSEEGTDLDISRELDTAWEKWRKENLLRHIIGQELTCGPLATLADRLFARIKDLI